MAFYGFPIGEKTEPRCCFFWICACILFRPKPGFRGNARRSWWVDLESVWKVKSHHTSMKIPGEKKLLEWGRSLKKNDGMIHDFCSSTWTRNNQWMVLQVSGFSKSLKPHGTKITETQSTPHKNTNPSRLQIPSFFEYIIPKCGQRTLFFVDHIGLQELSKIAGISKCGIILD